MYYKSAILVIEEINCCNIRNGWEKEGGHSMIIGNKEYSRVVFTNTEGLILAAITDDDQVLVREGYDVVYYPAEIEEAPEEMVEVDIITYGDEPESKHIL